MLQSRNYDKWLAKQMGRYASMRGWNKNRGRLKLARRRAHFQPKALSYRRMSLGRHPGARHLKGFSKRLTIA